MASGGDYEKDQKHSDEEENDEENEEDEEVQQVQINKALQKTLALVCVQLKELKEEVTILKRRDGSGAEKGPGKGKKKGGKNGGGESSSSGGP